MLAGESTDILEEVMSRNVSEKTKKKQGRSRGSGAEYTSYIRANEIPGHLGNTYVERDWIAGRPVHLLSSGEQMLYYILRFRDDVLDVREQFPLPIESTLEIVSKYKGFRHPVNKFRELVPYTTDFLVDLSNGQQEAYSVKYSLDDLMKHNTQIQNLFVQREYWVSLGVDFKQVFTVDMNNALFQNISRTVYYYDKDTVQCTVDLYKHLIARKLIRVDMDSKVITSSDFYSMAQKLLGGIDVEAVKRDLRLKYLEEAVS